FAQSSPLNSSRRGPLTSLFFFSSRRRHTRCYRDWSSDVCSSDLDPRPPMKLLDANPDHRRSGIVYLSDHSPGRRDPYLKQYINKIGRASCRERVQKNSAEGGRKKKKANATKNRHDRGMVTEETRG